ncbi:hypothetical protein NTGBS_1110004 [Candidatus Nitrotoga sp. BS]|nr:hypothetical protein NTGBS_1110004 [Candidatus Nitrotoga sp. BS]
MLRAEKNSFERSNHVLFSNVDYHNLQLQSAALSDNLVQTLLTDLKWYYSE